MTPKQKVVAGILGGGLVLTAGVVYAMTRKRNGVTFTPEVHDALTNPTKTLAPSPSMNPADAAKAAVTAIGAAKAIGGAIKSLLTSKGVEVATTEVAAQAGESAAGEVLANGGTVTEAANAGAEAGGVGVGGSALLGVAVAVAAIGIVIGWAISLGVFSEKDWQWPYGQVPFKLNDYGASVAGLPSGSIVWLQPSFVDQMKADGPEAGLQRLYSHLEANRKATEDRQAAMRQIQSNVDADQKAQEDLAAAQQRAYEADQAARAAAAAQAAAQDAQARAAADLLAQQTAAAALAAQQEAEAAAIAAQQAAYANSQPVKQAIAQKVYGNPGTQFNGLGGFRKPLALGSGFGMTGHARILR